MNAFSEIGGASAGDDAAIEALFSNDQPPRVAKTKVARKGKRAAGHSQREVQAATADGAQEFRSDADSGRDHVFVDTQNSDVASALIPIGGDAEGESGHFLYEDQSSIAALAKPIRDSQVPIATHCWRAVTTAGEAGQHRHEAHRCSADLSGIIIPIRAQWRMRQAWHRAEKSLTLQAKALCRGLAEGGDKKEADVIYNAALSLKGATHPEAFTALAMINPLTTARDSIAVNRKAIEKELDKLAKQLPVIEWLDGVLGVASGSLAGIIGEAGDLTVGPGNYENPGKLWKRMGLAVFGGIRQRRVAGEAAIEQGYVAARRSLVWNVGENILKAQIRVIKDADGKDTGERRALGQLGQLYLDRKIIEFAKCEAIAADDELRAKFGGAKYAPKAHAHNRAKRYIEKRFLRDLWAAWNGRGGQQMLDVPSNDAAAPAELAEVSA